MRETHRRVIVAFLVAVILGACGVTASKAYRNHAGYVGVANDDPERAVEWTLGERVWQFLTRARRAVTPTVATAEGADGMAYYLFYVESEFVPGQYQWVMDTSVFEQGATTGYETNWGSAITGPWLVGGQAAPAPTVTASGAGYLVEGAGSSEYNGQYDPNGDTCNGQPVYELLVSPFAIHVGGDGEEQERWDDGTKHRISKFGPVGSGWDVTLDEEIDTTEQTPPLQIVMPDGTDASNFHVYISINGHRWATCNLTGIAPNVNVSQAYSTDYVPWLPQAKHDEIDSWTTILGAAGTKTIRVDLSGYDETYGGVEVWDTAVYTMFIPEVVISEPEEDSTVGEAFDVEFSMSEWYAPTSGLFHVDISDDDGESYAPLRYYGGGTERGTLSGTLPGTVSGSVNLWYGASALVAEGDCILRVVFVFPEWDTVDDEQQVLGTTDITYVSSGFSVKMGSDAGAQALWDDASKHRWSKFGPTGGGYDVDGATTLDPQGAPPVSITMPAGVAAGYCKVRIKCAGATWGEAVLSGTAPSISVGSIVDPYSGSYWLPYSAADGDAWDTILGSAGAKAITIELVRKSDDVVMASDTGAFTMFVPEVVISSPSGTVPDVFDVEFSLSECYTSEMDFDCYATPDGDAQLSNTGWVTGDPTGTITGEVDLQFDFGVSPGVPGGGLHPLDPGAFELEITASDESRITGSASLTHADTYTIEITTPSEGATVTSPISATAHIAQGWPESGDTFKWYQQVSGLWSLLATQYAADAGSTRFSGLTLASAYLSDDVTGLRVVWLNLAAVELASDTISITVSATVDPPPEPEPDDPDPGPNPDPDESPKLWWSLPPNGATVAGEFTGTIKWSGYHAGTGALKIVAVGPDTVTLFDAAYSIGASSGTMYQALDFDGAATGDYTLYATLTNGAYSETASDAITVTLSGLGSVPDDPPEVSITVPDNGASVTGTVTVDVTATDDVSVFSVCLYVDGVFYQRQDAPTTGSTYRFSWDSTAFVNGSHTLSAVAWDSNLQTASDSIVVNLVNAQADLERVLFTKQLGYSGGAPLNTESARFRDLDFKRGILVAEWPDEDDLPSDVRQRYNVYCGYHCPGNSVDFSEYTLIQEGRSFAIPAGNRSIRWAMKAVPQRTTAYWELACDEAIRLAANASGDVLALCVGPASVQRLSRQSGEIIEVADLSTLPSAPVDMVVASGKVLVAYADRVLVLDEDEDDLGFEVLLPWTDGIDSITALASDGDTAWIAADLTAGGSAVYEYTYPSARLVASHANSVTALQYMLSGLYAGDDAGQILQLGTGLLSTLYATGEAAITRLGVNGAVPYAGTSTSGRIYYRLGSWGAYWDSGWSSVGGIAAFDGWAYAGGLGTGGTYLWYEAQSGAWAQTVALEGCTGVNDLINVTASDGHDQLFAATVGVAGVTRLYRIEKSAASDYVCGISPPHFVGKILRG